MPDEKQEFEATIIEERKKDNMIGYRNSSSTKITIKGSASRHQKDNSSPDAPFSDEFTIA